ncbi:unnamed protein product [Orchesella dallaii]|uniref:Uncharacterized protein n=1 Tax=Orchesella dallaii TaxID=48710 RepID=A0ABP1QPH5_9HEXA
MTLFVTTSGLKAIEKPPTVDRTLQNERVVKQTTDPQVTETTTPPSGSINAPPEPVTPLGTGTSQGTGTPLGPGTPPEPPTPIIEVPGPNDRGNCMGHYCYEKEACMQDYSSDSNFKCKWSIENLNSTNSFQIIGGHCDHVSKPPDWGADGSKPMCVETSAINNPSYHCVCAIGKCPQEFLKYCEHDYLYQQAKSLVSSVIRKSEEMYINQPCSYKLEQQLPQTIVNYAKRINLYRVVSILRNASRDGICNRRTLSTCRPNNICGCADGTSQKVTIDPSGIYTSSYHCYATTGRCGRDPASVIPQFEEIKIKIRKHYGDPSVKIDHDPNGCLMNFCKLNNGEECINN